jgi:DNA-binding transcriptional LysR family regulator
VVTFAAVARERSFSRAAAALSLSQPAVSQQISALETEVGARLLDRRPEGLVLTKAGRALLEHAAVIAERLELADVQLRELVHGELPPLRSERVRRRWPDSCRRR